MAKVTLSDNLVPCERTVSAPYIDLTESVDIAQMIAKAATQHFFLRRYSAMFSGYIAHRPGVFCIELWHEGEMLRCFRVSDLAYSGAMFIDVVPGRLDSSIGFDFLGALHGVESAIETSGLTCELVGSQRPVQYRPAPPLPVMPRPRRPRTRREAVDVLLDLLQR